MRERKTDSGRVSKFFSVPMLAPPEMCYLWKLIDTSLSAMIHIVICLVRARSMVAGCVLCHFNYLYMCPVNDLCG